MRATKWIGVTSLLAVCGMVTGAATAEKPGRTTDPAIKIFDGRPKTIIVNGYSTSFHWPAMLQRKLDRFSDGKQVVTVKSATKGGTPIARWMDVETGEPLRPWRDILRPALQKDGKQPVIVLAQQSLQWAYGGRREGIRSKNDRQRIGQGADALGKYVKLLREDGADLVIVAVHIYKRSMEPEIGNERYALDELLRRKPQGVERGPDVWTATKELYPRGFASDRKHPNSIGAEVMAQMWFETLIKREGFEIPSWSRQEMEEAKKNEPVALPGSRKSKRGFRRRKQ